MPPELDYTFSAMGSDVRLLIGERVLRDASEPLAAADRERAYVLDFAQRLSRFRADSELSALNRDPRPEVPCSPLLRAAVGAGLWAAARSGGLLDPTLVAELERNGYDHSLDGAEPASLRAALERAPARQPARPRPDQRWRALHVDDKAGTIVRPAGLQFDTGGTGKGLCADAVAIRLRGYARVLVDCGGDIAVAGLGAQLEPYEVEVEHPLTRLSIGSISVSRGGIATSGLNVRIWRRPDGSFMHHLLDPSTGASAWTGLIGVTALGASALEAETLSKLALLLGPDGARETLAEQGGVIIHDDGGYEVVGPVKGSIAERGAAPAAA